MTSEQIQQYVRVALYWIFGALASYGVAVPDQAKGIAIAIVGTLATLAWTAYGTRLNAKINEIAKSPDVQKIVVADPVKAGEIPSDKVVSGN